MSIQRATLVAFDFNSADSSAMDLKQSERAEQHSCSCQRLQIGRRCCTTIERSTDSTLVCSAALLSADSSISRVDAAADTTANETRSRSFCTNLQTRRRIHRHSNQWRSSNPPTRIPCSCLACYDGQSRLYAAYYSIEHTFDHSSCSSC